MKVHIELVGTFYTNHPTFIIMSHNQPSSGLKELTGIWSAKYTSSLHKTVARSDASQKPMRLMRSETKGSESIWVKIKNREDLSLGSQGSLKIRMVESFPTLFCRPWIRSSLPQAYFSKGKRNWSME